MSGIPIGTPQAGLALWSVLMNVHKIKAMGATAATATATMALCIGLGALPAKSAMAEFAPSFAPLVDQVKGAVVNISATEVEQNVAAEGDDGMQQMPPGMQEFM